MLRAIVFCSLVLFFWTTPTKAEDSLDTILKALGLDDMFKNLGNGTSMNDIEKALKNIDLKKLLKNDELKSIVKQSGMDPKLVEAIISSIDMKSLMSAIDVKKIMSSVLSGSTTDVMGVIFGSLDFSKVTRSFDTTNLIKVLTGGFDLALPSLPNMTQPCQEQFNSLLAPYKNLSTQAAIQLAAMSDLGKYVDAWGKPPSRILLLNVNWLGAYDECKSLPDAKYCVTWMKLLMSDDLSGIHGSCIPNKCTVEDSFKLVKAVGESIPKYLLEFTFPLGCEKPMEFLPGFYCTVVLSAFILFFCTIGTLLEIFGCDNYRRVKRKPDQKIALTKYESNGETLEESPEVGEEETSAAGSCIINFFSCFALVKNMKAVVSTDVPNGAITSINGIRTISMMWVILGHTYFYTFFYPKDNGALSMNIVHRYSFLSIANAYVAVDTFFLLSGLLVAYLALKRMDKATGRMKLNVPMFYLHRFIRLTPPYMFAILLWNNIFPMVLTGPTAQLTREGNFREACRKYWWTNMLYINNFYPEKMSEECFGWAWYLANDMQFYVASPAILYLVHYLDRKYQDGKYQYFGAFIVTIAGCLLCFIVNASLYGVHDYPAIVSAATLLNNPRADIASEGQDKIYVKPYTRIAPYLVGLFLGYVLSRKILIKSKHKKIINLVCWLVAFLVAYGVVYGPYSVYKVGGTFLTKAQNVMYGSLHRLAFAMSVAWVVYACHNNAGGLINEFLSWRIWIPLSRLTFGAYLYHTMVISYFYHCLENPYHYQDNTVVYYYISMVVLSYGCAFILAVTVEYPVLNLEKMVFKR